MADKQMKRYTREEVAKHNSNIDLWIVIDSKVYDVSKFKSLHPGGEAVFLEAEIAGQDATDAFYSLHRHEVILRPQFSRLQVGILTDEESVIYGRVCGEPSTIPYGEPTWLSDGYYSPYYKESHRNLQKAMRKFVDDILLPDAVAREADGKRPSTRIVQAMTDLNINTMRMGPGPHLKGLELMGGVTSEEYDYFHELIVFQEIARCGERGYIDGLQSGAVIGLPPIINFGCEALKAKIVPEILSGEKFICLAVSEAFAGSDVAGLQCKATKTPDQKHWIINGSKKWITNGTFSDYFTIGCKTDKGLTAIVVERGEGVETRLITTSYSTASGTAYITFDNVKVPVENTLGPEGGGIFVILSNFNHERWTMCCNSARSQRMIVEECLKWTSQRFAFGKPLNAQAVVRNRLGAMISRTESVQNWLENITHQMCNMSYKEQAQRLAGPIAFLKLYCTRCAQQTAIDAVQLFGGRGLTKSGMGQLIEQFYRTAPFDAVLGGAEDVLGDLGARQAMRQMPKNVRL
ncbi:hypothetical protein SERLA73DRAFT_95759 [Serpula lacrymans var. lacrymans S7.3]|uniref:Cytochrome b5 heme-binding domain-containing protein n=2 Tax=Serpula lacrymans var. lacrymans TaxID=341189 RepID=F8Q934_SERL3|nr:uncharacterized protein SERLADRAFT_363449 [Serpula lacrymans var. lacrymans S7.9]EGN95089.1 hypothetical protein SERLA73DRAFT_95759 [Serpula lacrymans var. lacrymans S7.3]EGO20577.1 hypothetical protein SERLADRAFT_363449 [Serpula lacrymans var. lacrymans S7.9]